MATAEQTVSAVLESTNKRYVVETGTSEDGAIRYTRFSDGYLIIEGDCVAPAGIATMSLPVSFSNTNYLIVGTTHAEGSSSAVNGFKVDYTKKTESSFQYILSYASNGTGYGGEGTLFSFIAKGFAA